MTRSPLLPFNARVVLAFLLAGGASAFLSGCALLSDPKPKSDFQNTRYAETGDGKSSPADELRIPNQWSQFTCVLDQQFDTSSGVELMKSRRVFITTQADAAVLEVATTRAHESRVFAGDVTKGIVALGALYASMGASAGLEAVIPVVQSAIASMSATDKEKAGADLQSIVDDNTLTVKDKEQKIRAYLALHGDR